MGVRAISQEAFDDLVRENVEDLGMEPSEALEDALHTLKLQGVDLSGIITCVPGESSIKDNPVIACLDRLKEFDSVSIEGPLRDEDLDEISSLFVKLNELCCSQQDSGNTAIATKHGAVDLTCSLCSKIKIAPGSNRNRIVVPCLKALAVLIHDIQSTEAFRNCTGPSIIVGLLSNSISDSDSLDAGFAVVAAASTGNEVVKQSFMELKIDELILQVLKRESKTTVRALYDAICVLLTPDDSRVVASQVYGYARTFAKLGIATALTEALQAGIGSDSLVSASIALKAIAVNDEICKSIAEIGGIDTLLRCIDDSGEQGNKTAAKICCSLLSKLAGSDSNKSTIVEKRGLDKLIRLAQRFSDDPLVIQEVMLIISIICLRSPDHAAKAIEAGAGDLAVQAMKRFPVAAQMQRNACNMIRNMAVRNAENRTILLANGIEKLIRTAKANNELCRAAATDALRDLGLDNYNS
ncbi:PREDICTED: armadillo repeat-containing protein 6-like [Camelina sativa]|uniref:Armadillo repeat-containing protein 6-like n=1 Tax=Camelina sativa TaxID=90675 RepID=A0ABM0UW05_CAMSA|nr:PREDICTED: armadillo repeat-containing protein 6-like [Camelina sativa]